MKFVDEAKITVKTGNGGHDRLCVNFPQSQQPEFKSQNAHRYPTETTYKAT